MIGDKAKDWDEIVEDNQPIIQPIIIGNDEYHTQPVPRINKLGGIRTYKNNVYFKIEEGWILLDDLLEEIEKLNLEE